MENKKLIDLFKSNGLLFPTTETEIEEFLNNNDIQDEEPIDWDNPISIIQRGLMDVTKFDLFGENISEKEVQNYSMAARDGKKISKSVRMKMNTDKNGSRKK